MRDIVGMISIGCYWFILALILTLISADTSLQESQTAFDGSDLNTTVIDTSNLNVTDTDAGSTVGSVSFLNMFFCMITFRIPTVAGFPSIIINFIEIANFMLVVVFGLLFYRQIRSGSG